jgi:hypothetical protein
MSNDHERYGRQIRLPEIGEAGQARLAASAVVLRASGPAQEVEATYLKAAGAKVVESTAATPEPPTEAKAHAAALAGLGVRDSEARIVAEGALRALEAMRAVLGVVEGDGAEPK